MFESPPDFILHCGACGSPQISCPCHKIAELVRCPDTGRMRRTVPMRQMMQQQHVGVLMPRTSEQESADEAVSEPSELSSLVDSPA